MKYALKDFSDKYYKPLNEMLQDMAEKCTGGEEVTIKFPTGKITIKLY